MNSYKVSFVKPWQHFLDICFQTDVRHNLTVVQLPYWRPGRYEAGNFARNIQKFKVVNERGETLRHKKITSNSWEVNTQNCTQIQIFYNYYAAEYNAGSTYLDEERLTINPVNCFLYIHGKENEESKIEIVAPEDYKIATGLKKDGNVLFAADLQQLLDCPIIVTPHLQHISYTIEEVEYHIWLDGENQLDKVDLEKDFKAFTEAQLRSFGSLPVKDYHFLIGISPYKAYHGVEHENSTMIVIGPSSEVHQRKLYLELLGVSSHELYHTWNVKYIRPSDWSPYNFTGPSYSRLGYVAEGVTTYYGDVMLWRSDCFSDEEYLEQLSIQFQRHLENGGRQNLSVADSSFDTWIDGYSRGIPNRKVSIYTEGCLLALICDVLIMKNSGNRYSLNEVMRSLYGQFGYNEGGYSEDDYWNCMKEVAPEVNWNQLRSSLIDAPGDYTPYLHKALEYLGLYLEEEESKSFTEAFWGIKTMDVNGATYIYNVYPGSVAEKSGLWFGDTIAKFNGQTIKGNLDVLAQENQEEVKILLETPYQKRQVQLKADRHSVFFKSYKLKKFRDSANFNFWKQAGME